MDPSTWSVNPLRKYFPTLSDVQIKEVFLRDTVLRASGSDSLVTGMYYGNKITELVLESLRKDGRSEEDLSAARNACFYLLRALKANELASGIDSQSKNPAYLGMDLRAPFAKVLKQHKNDVKNLRVSGFGTPLRYERLKKSMFYEGVHFVEADIESLEKLSNIRQWWKLGYIGLKSVCGEAATLEVIKKLALQLDKYKIKRNQLHKNWEKRLLQGSIPTTADAKQIRKLV